jgi:hypothetical protein
MRYLFITILAALLLQGCEPPIEDVSDSIANFEPAGITINRLTEISMIDNYNSLASVDIFIDINDTFGVNIKYPGIFRFELYEFKPLSANEKGKMIYRWPPYDLTDAKINNSLWQDPLRCYVFSLELEAQLDKSKKYVLTAAFANPSRQLRLSDKRAIQYNPQ